MALAGLGLLHAGTEAIARAEGPDALDARITEIKGEVTLFGRDQGEEGVPAEEGMPLEPGDRIKTGADGRAELGLDGNSVVELAPGTELSIDSLERKSAAFELGIGTLLAKIKAGLFGEDGSLEVRTPAAVAAVRGTEFGVENTGEEGAHVAVFDEGRVAVRGSGAETILERNQETSVARGGAPARARALSRFVQHRKRLGFMRTRAAALHRRWKLMPPAQRAEARRKMIERRREILQRLRERREEQQPKRRGRPQRRDRRP